MRRAHVLVLLTISTVGFAQNGYDPRAPGLDVVDDNGKVISTIWETDLVEEHPDFPEEAYEVDSTWSRLIDHEHRDKNLVSSIKSEFASYQSLRNKLDARAYDPDVKKWYSDLAELNMRSMNRTTDVLKKIEATNAYDLDRLSYEGVTVSEQNEAMMNAWYTRLNTEYKRLIAWGVRIDATDRGLSVDGKKLSDRADALNNELFTKMDDAFDLWEPLVEKINRELLIADKRAEVEEQRDKIRKNNEGIRTLMDVSASVQEIEDWAKLDKERREKGMWEAARSLLDVALAQTSMKYTSNERITRAELRRFKLDIMYKYKLHPDHVKKILKNWVDDGRSVLTIKTKREFFEQLGVVLNLAEGVDKADKSKYLEAAATALGFFNKSPVLGLVVTNAQIYTGLFETALTYYESKQRVGQLMDLSESNLKAVAALAERNKALVAALKDLKKEHADLESQRTY